MSTINKPPTRNPLPVHLCRRSTTSLMNTPALLSSLPTALDYHRYILLLPLISVNRPNNQ